MQRKLTYVLFASFLLSPVTAIAGDLNGLGPALERNRITQEQIKSEALTRDQIRFAGRDMFITPFDKSHGYGDGPPATDYEGRRELGGRVTLQANGTYLRINGLDAQACLECHSIVSTKTKPFLFGIGGVGGVNNTVLGAGGASYVNANDNPDQMVIKDTIERRNINGRVINPPFVFGSGGVELLGKEMTHELQRKYEEVFQEAEDNQGVAEIELETKGVYFGTLRAVWNGIEAQIELDEKGNFKGVEGVDAKFGSLTCLVVQPFGRKGDNITTRTFDRGAFPFHQGMFPVELVGEGVDNDGDGVINEVLIGELSAINIFMACIKPPRQELPPNPAEWDKVMRGFKVFEKVGCVDCHRPVLHTKSKDLPFSHPEVPKDPHANVYYSVDLTEGPMHFRENEKGGVSVPLFADLKRHWMGESLAEFNGDAWFTTARLWGCADTAPYLHDGRAFTLMEAIEMHGQGDSEAAPIVKQFLRRSKKDKWSLIAFLSTLRTPRDVGADLVRFADQLETEEWED